jgi:hypothetical protein
MNTLTKLYLGSEPTAVKVDEDRLLITLADGRSIAIPLQLVGQLGQDESPSAEAQILILRQPPQIDHVHVTDTALNVYLKDSRLLACPLAWFPRLMHGTPSERNHYELSGDDDVIHWPDLDEDIELSRLFEGGKSAESERSIRQWLLSRQTSLETNLTADEA